MSDRPDSGVAPPPAAAARWCGVCCTDHPASARCPGELRATGPERPGWKVNVRTQRGIEAVGVLLAVSDERWRARILTYPNVLWLVPGGSGTIKFVGRTSEEAERKARDFIRAHCAARGYLMRDEIAVAAPPGPGQPLPRPVSTPQDPRYFRALPVSYGERRPVARAVTADLSEGGLFVSTERPAAVGRSVKLLLQLEHCTVPLLGVVVWVRRRAEPGRPAGMGVRLHDPPPAYVRYVRSLG